MFTLSPERLPSQFSRSLSPLPAFSSLRAPSVSAFNSLLPICHPERTEGSAFPDPRTLLAVFQKSVLTSPFTAVLTDRSQRNENKRTLSPAFATLTGNVKRKSFVCHSYKKHGGWGTGGTCVSSRHSATCHSPLLRHTETLHFAVLPAFGNSNFTDRTIPAPSFTTINWFGFTSFNVSTAPLGQRISSNSTFSALPIPK